MTSPRTSTDRVPREVGREQELADVRALRRRPDVRLLTLTGSPGAGKTRLALELDDDEWERGIQDNLTSHFSALRTLLPLVATGGALVHLSGLSSDSPYPGAALIGATNALKK